MSALWIKWLAALLLGLGVLGTTCCLLVDRTLGVRVQWVRYTAHLDARLTRLMCPRIGAGIALAQLLVALAAAGVVIVSGAPGGWWLVALGAIGLSPVLVLREAGRRRLSTIERDLNGFSIALANSLRVSPSIGKALARVHAIQSGPLAEELELTLNEAQLGTPVDEALANLSRRVGSTALDTTLAGVLIGRQVGGNISANLETTAATLREMDRIEGMIRTKTAEGRGQLWVLALAPAVVFAAFDNMQKGYFEPLLRGPTGMGMLCAAFVLWGAGVFAAHKILQVDV